MRNENDPPIGGPRLAASAVALVVAIAALVVLAIATSSDAPVIREPQSAPSAAEPVAAPPEQLEANLREGNVLIDTPLEAKLAALRGVPVVVNQWASWCPPCRAEFPYFEELAEEYKDRVAFLGLNARDGRVPAEAFLAEHAVNYPSVYDESGDQARTIGAGRAGRRRSSSTRAAVRCSYARAATWTSRRSKRTSAATPSAAAENRIGARRV